MPIETLNDLLDLYRDRFEPEKAAGIDAVVQLDITGEGGGKHVLTIRDQTLTIEEGTHDDPAITLRSSLEDFMELNLGDANPMSLIMTGKVKLSGSMPLAMKFQKLFFGS